MPPKSPATVTAPSLVVLPVLTGRTRDFEGLVRRVRDFVAYRETSAGPWLFEPSSATPTLWHWVARSGFGDSCRDARILDEFAELVFAYDPLAGVVGVLPWRPSSRGILSADAVILNQALAFIGAHLESPRQFAFYATPQIGGRDAETGFVERASSGRGGDYSADIYSLAMYATVEAVYPDDDEDEWDFEVPDLDSSYFVADWLDVLLYEPYPEDQLRYLEEHPILTPADLHERLDKLHADYFMDVPGREEAAFRMTVEALFGRVLERTGTLRGLYRHFAEVWPALPELRLGYPTAAVTFCLTQPELAREVAEVSCSFCEGCSREPDVTTSVQLALDLG